MLRPQATRHLHSAGDSSTSKPQFWDHRPDDVETINSSWCKKRAEIDRCDKEAVDKLPKLSDKQYSMPVPTNQLQFIPSIKIPESFSKLRSDTIEDEYNQITYDRDYFLQKGEDGESVHVASYFVPASLLVHLTRHVDDNSYKVKHLEKTVSTPATRIRNSEALFRNFITGVGASKMGADIARGYTSDKLASLGKGKFRTMLISDQLNLDFENVGQMLYELTAASATPLKGEPLPNGFTMPTEEEKNEMTADQLAQYDNQLMKHLVFHLFPSGERPSKDSIRKENLIDKNDAQTLLENLIREEEDIDLELLKEKYVIIDQKDTDSSYVSLYVLFLICLHQVRNEGAILESLGVSYTSTLNPSTIFCGRLGALIHNRLRCLAFKYLGVHHFNNMKLFVPLCENDCEKKEHPGLASLYKTVFGDRFKDMKAAADEGGKWKFPEKSVALIHNNGDPLANNLRNEDEGGSLDGSVGAWGSGCISLGPDKPEQLKYCTILQPNF